MYLLSIALQKLDHLIAYDIFNLGKTFGGISLFKTFLDKNCNKYQNEKTGCKYLDCPADNIEIYVNYLLKAQRVGYKWLEIGTVANCQVFWSEWVDVVVVAVVVVFFAD